MAIVKTDVNQDYNSFSFPKEGVARLRIKTIKAKTAKSGTNGYGMTIEVSGGDTVFHDLWITDKTKGFISEFGRSFGVDVSSLDDEIAPTSWIGSLGAGEVYHEEHNAKTYAKLKNFIKKDKQVDLPAFEEKEATPASAPQNTDIDDKVPF